MPAKRKLTAKQKRFADLYIDSCNATQSYLQVYQCKSKAGARASASKLLTNSNVERYIDERREVIDSEVLHRQIVTKERVLQEDARLAFADIGEMFDKNGKVRELHDVPMDLRAAIKIAKYDKIRVGTDEQGNPVYRSYLKYISLHNKGSAMNRLEKIYGMYQKKNEPPIISEIKALLEEIDGMDRGKLPIEKE